ncbi:MAG TPA: hypothetical protein PKH31_04460 [Candidatus Sumerlaeota bacterium]|nr:hypothetical protein [Candidatus Sumerlaeota bacterium]
MNGELQLSEEEGLELDLLVKQALDSAKVELHHTVTRAYKDRVKERIRLLEQVLVKLEPLCASKV